MRNKNITATAAALDKENKKITIFPGSILSTINPVEVMNNNTMGGLDVKIANILGNELSNIKDNIIPLIKELGTKVNEIVAESSNSPLFANIALIGAEIPEVISSMIERDMIKTSGSKLNQLSNTALIMPTPEVAIIRGYLKGGGGQMESLIKNFASTISDESLVRIWETYLNRVTKDNTNYIGLGTKVNDGRFASDLFVLSIIVKTLINEVPTGVRATSGTYDNVIATLNSVLDAKIVNLVRLLESNAKLGKLIFKADGLEEIIVIKETYDTYLKADGVPEAIYGAVIKGLKTASINTVVSLKDECIAEWDKYVSNETVKNKMNMLETYRMAYRFALTDLINNFMSKEIKDQIDPNVILNHGDILIKYMNSLQYMELYNVNTIVEHIVGSILFEHTNTCNFIGYMKQYSKMNNALTAKEAATYASVDLIIDFLVTQIEIK